MPVCRAGRGKFWPRIRIGAENRSALKGSLGSDNEILRAREQELAAARAEMKRNAETEIKLRAEIEAFGNDRTQAEHRI